MDAFHNGRATNVQHCQRGTKIDAISTPSGVFGRVGLWYCTYRVMLKQKSAMFSPRLPEKVAGGIIFGAVGGLVVLGHGGAAAVACRGAAVAAGLAAGVATGAAAAYLSRSCWSSAKNAVGAAAWLCCRELRRHGGNRCCSH